MRTEAAQSNPTANADKGIFPAGALAGSQMPGGTFLGLLSSASTNPLVTSNAPSEVEATTDKGVPRTTFADGGSKKNFASGKKIPQQAASASINGYLLPAFVPTPAAKQNPLPISLNIDSTEDVSRASIQRGEDALTAKSVRIGTIPPDSFKNNALPAMNPQNPFSKPAPAIHLPGFSQQFDQQLLSSEDAFTRPRDIRKISDIISNVSRSEFAQRDNSPNSSSIPPARSTPPDLPNVLTPSLAANGFSEGTFAMNLPDPDPIVSPDETSTGAPQISPEPQAVGMATGDSLQHANSAAVVSSAWQESAILNQVRAVITPVTSTQGKLVTGKSSPDTSQTTAFRIAGQKNAVQKITAKVENNQGSVSSLVPSDHTIHTNPIKHRAAEASDIKQSTTETNSGNGIPVHDSDSKDSNAKTENNKNSDEKYANDKDANIGAPANALIIANIALHPAAPVHSASLSADIINPAALIPHVDTSVSKPASTLPATPEAAPTIKDVPITEGSGNVQVAHIADKAGQSEMHIGMRIPLFGSVEVHTSVHQNQVGVVVGSEHGDLKTFLNAEIPMLRENLNQQDLQFSNVRFLETGNHSGNFLTDSGAHSGSQQPPHKSNAPWLVFHAESATTNEEVFVASQIGLSIHA